MRDQTDDRRAAPIKRRQRRGHISVQVNRRVFEACLQQLGHQQPREFELAGRAGRAVAVPSGLRVDPHIPEELLAEVIGDRGGQ